MCAMYGTCGKKSVFGADLPCAGRKAPQVPSSESVLILRQICGDIDPSAGVCCSQGQLLTLEENLKRVDPLISSCPACRKNFYDFFCKFTCSPNQADFLNVTETVSAMDTGKDIVSRISVYTDKEYAEGFYDSCKNIKFAATNGYAMDLIGGGARDYMQFLKFLGDEKPLLGGSPFQIDFAYEPSAGFSPMNGVPKHCDDAVYKCACSDCPVSCPVLPNFKDFRAHCSILGMPCFSFAVFIIWLNILTVLGLVHVFLLRKQVQLSHFDGLLNLRSNLRAAAAQDDSEFCTVESREPEETSDFDTELTHLISEYDVPSKFLPKMAFYARSYLHKLSLAVEAFLGNLSLVCASNPFKTIAISLIVVLLCSSGLFKLQWETDPVKLWVSSDEPALKNKLFFDSSFGEWFRIEQLIILNKDKSLVMSWDTIQWWFEKELELYDLKDAENKSISLDSFCFKPTQESCAIQSFAQYFHGNIGYLLEENWRERVSECAESPVNCLPTFQQPLKKNILFSDDNAVDSRAFVVTLLLRSDSKNQEYSDHVDDYEKALLKWMQKLEAEKPHLAIAYSTERSLEEELNRSTNTDVKIVVLSYAAMFFYASVALGRKFPRRVSLQMLSFTRFSLGLAGIVIILLGVFAAAGMCAFLNIKSTLIIAEVIPFLVLAVGVDNVFLIVHELKRLDKEYGDIPARISAAVAKIGPSCLMSFILQFSMFLLATNVKMPAVHNFAIFSAGSIAMNFALQMTLFIAILALDQRRLEHGKLDIFFWKSAPDVQDLAYVHYDLSSFVGSHLGPWLMQARVKRTLLVLFTTLLGVSLSLIPLVSLGLDQTQALPEQSYLVQYFRSVYEYLNVGPPIFFVTNGLDVTQRQNQQKLCGKFSTCREFSMANILEQEYKRSKVSLIAEPASNWLDDFLGWMNPELDQCCRFKTKRNSGESHFESFSLFGDREFCSPHALPRQCEPCYAGHNPPYNTSMEGFPEGNKFMGFFKQWITEPSDPCPLGGKAPYSTSVHWNETHILSSYLRTNHPPLRSGDDFIVAYQNSLRIVEEMKEKTLEGTDVFAFSPFYVFFVQYVHIVRQTVGLLALASGMVWVISAVFMELARVASIMTVVVVSAVVHICGVMAVWGISLNAVSLVNLVICLGLAVEFTIHISKGYLNEKRLEDEHNTENLERFLGETSRNSRELYTLRALEKIGGSILGGITITKFIGVSVLFFTRSKIFEVYYFRMWFSLVVIASTHALILLPILLSTFG